MSDYVRSIPFVGNKSKLLPDLLPNLTRPQFTRFLDMTCGSGVVGANVNYDNVLLNDNNFQVIQILSHLYREPANATLEILDAVINNADFKQEFIAEYPDLRKNNPKSKLPNLTSLFSEFKRPEDYVLSAKNKNAYYLLRAVYNFKLSDPYVLLTLMYHSFQNMLRFNRAGGANMPFGQRTFNDTARINLVEFIEKLQTKTVAFMDWPIENFDLTKFKTTDLLYFDPPYENAGAAYNVIWDDHKDGKTLLEILDHANNLGKFWAMSNVFHNNGKHNAQVEKWAEKYDVVYLDADYSNSYYTRQPAKTVEVLIKNYA